MRIGLLLVLVACSGEPAPAPVPAPVPVSVPEPEPAAAPEPVVLPVPSEPRYAATHVLVAWKGAVDAPPSVTRTEPEARELAASLRERALAGEPLEELAREHSDGPSAPRGGDLGVYLTGTMVPEFEAAVASVEVGRIGPLVRTPFGWHVVRRDAVVEVTVSQVIVTWEGAVRSSATRSKEEARARIEEARQALADGTPFAEVATRFSDGPEASRGGDLGRVARGQMVPAFEEVAFGLEPGQTSDVVETPYGFHLVRRTE